MLTFVVFVVSSLLIVVQLASAQLTPRIIAMVFADWRLKWVLSAFTFAYTYTIAASGRINDMTPQLPVAFAIVCNLVCIAIFFWFVQWLGGSLRPIAVIEAVAQEGRAVVETVYPEPFDPAEEQQGWSAVPESDASTVEHVGTSGVVLAFDQRDLVAIAERADVVIELVPQVGDFVARGDPLFRVRCGGRPVEAGALRSSVAIGPERTMEQDPRFAFRIMVDIANKALSPAINDPTTAVLALDQIHRLLMHVGKRRLDAGQAPTPRAGCASATGRRTGSISSVWPSRKFATTAPAACRWRAGSISCSSICCVCCPKLARRRWNRNSPCCGGLRSVLLPTKKIALARPWVICKASAVRSRRSISSIRQTPDFRYGLPARRAEERKCDDRAPAGSVCAGARRRRWGSQDTATLTISVFAARCCCSSLRG